MQEAKALNHHFVGMEHIPARLLSEGGGVAAHVLQKQKLATFKPRGTKS